MLNYYFVASFGIVMLVVIDLLLARRGSWNQRDVIDGWRCYTCRRDGCLNHQVKAFKW